MYSISWCAFSKIVSHHKGSDTNIVHPVWSLRLYSGSYQGPLCSSCDCLTCSASSHVYPLIAKRKELHEAYKKCTDPGGGRGYPSAVHREIHHQWSLLLNAGDAKNPERSHSTELNLSSSSVTNPMKYLRQQSLPPPKFTATVETTHRRPSVSDACQQAVGSLKETVLLKQCLCWRPSLTPSPKLKRFQTPKVGVLKGRNQNWTPGEKKHLISGRCGCFYQTKANALTCTVMKFMFWDLACK